MTQLSLFNAEEFYEFPKDLLEYMENFLGKEDADLLQNILLAVVSWEQRTQKTYDKKVLSPRLTDSKYNESEEDKKPTNPWTPEFFSSKEKN